MRVKNAWNYLNVTEQMLLNWILSYNLNYQNQKILHKMHETHWITGQSRFYHRSTGKVVWTISSTVESRPCILWSVDRFQVGESRYSLLMKPNKVETAVQWFRMSRAEFARFSGHGNSNYNIIPLLKKENVHEF